MIFKADHQKQLQALAHICRSLSNMETADIVEEVGEKFESLAQRFELSLIILAGSYATGKAKTGSDLDIAVILSNTGGKDLLRTEAVISRELWSLLNPSCEIDLIILNSAGSLMKRNVVNTGIPLYVSSPELWRAFRLRVCREFEDNARFRDRRWRQVKGVIAHG